MMNKFEHTASTTNAAETAKKKKIVFPQAELKFRYACCGNCRYFDGDDWCGRHRCRTTGGDHCACWEE